MTTAMSCPTLLTRIQGFSLSDPSADVSFESKLAAESGWTLGHANVVTGEYRRFLYLTQSAGQPMCPSSDVDRAWHLHLTQTRSYRMFCENVLGRFLHHNASKEGPSELAKHRAMYRATLEAYRSTFGEPPPKDIWPAVEVRFCNGELKRTEPTWQLPEVLKHGRTSQAVVVLSAACIAWALNVIIGDPLWNRLPGIHFGLTYVLAMVGVGVAFTVIRRRRTARITGAPVVDAYEAAWLAGGHERVLGTAVAGLIDRGLLDLSPEKKDDKITGAHCRRSPKDADIGKLDRVEQACLEAVRGGDLDFDRLRRTTAAVLSAIPCRLEKAGLLLRAGEMGRSRAVAAMLMFALLVIGFSRFGHVISEGHWFPSLLPAFIWLNLLLLFRLIAAQGQPSVLGRKVLADMQARHSDLKAGKPAEVFASAPRYAGSVSLVILAFALFGTQAVMASEAFAGINFVFGEDKTNPTGNSGSTAGCGVDGGGCGGCGGCGG